MRPEPAARTAGMRLGVGRFYALHVVFDGADLQIFPGEVVLIPPYVSEMAHFVEALRVQGADAWAIGRLSSNVAPHARQRYS